MGTVYEGSGDETKCPNCKCPLIISGQSHTFSDCFGYLDEFETKKAIKEWKQKKRNAMKCRNCGHNIVKMNKRWWHNSNPERAVIGYSSCRNGCNCVKAEPFKGGEIK